MTVLDANHIELHAPAIAAVKQWRFKPARKDSRPVDSVVVIPVRFAVPGADG